MAQVKAIAPSLLNLVLNIGPTTSIKNQVSNPNNMKLVAIFVISYRLLHQNNINYLLLIIKLYLYFARIRVNTLILLNHLRLLVLYNILQKNLRNITQSNQVQSRNRPLTVNLLERGIILNIEKMYTVNVQVMGWNFIQ